MKEFSTLGRLLIAAIAVFGLALVLGGAGYVVSQTLRPPPVKPVLFADLSGTWEIVGADSDASTSASSTITLPDASHDFSPTPWVQWVSYRRTFDTPTDCASVDCSLLIGEFFSAAAIYLNGKEVAQDALLPPAKHKGRNFYLLAPVEKLLAPPGERNTLEIKALGDASKYFSGPVAGPMGVVNSSVGARFQTFHRFTLSAFCLAMAVAFAFTATILVALGATWKLHHRAFGLFVLYCLCHVGHFAVGADRSNLFVSPIWAVALGYALGGRAVDVALLGLAYVCLPEQPKRHRVFQAVFRAICWPAALTSLVVIGVAFVMPNSLTGPSLALAFSEPYWVYKLFLNVALIVWCAMDKKINEQRQVLGILALLLIYNGALLMELPHGGYVHRAYYFALACFLTTIALRRAYREEVLREEGVRRDADVGKLARQIAHDIRSPLAALAISTRELTDLDEEARLLTRGAIDRINDIANHLLKGAGDTSQAQTTDRGPRVVSLVPIVDGLVSEARARHRAKRQLRFAASFEVSSYGAFVNVAEADLCRAISNLINNAAEASNGPCTVTVRVEMTDGAATVHVEDTGCGMPAHVVAKLGHRGFTAGKENGHGLGTSQAMGFAHAHGGRVQYASKVGQGTAAQLILPAVAAPAWFPKAIELHPGQAVVVVDDDPSIHNLWERRFKGYSAGGVPVTLWHFSSAEEFKAASIPAGALFLADCELIGSNQSGLDLIAALPTRKSAYLVTSHAEETSVQVQCAQLGCKLLSKSAAALAPIVTSPSAWLGEGRSMAKLQP